ncbi:MAG: N-acetyltransferase, partial [Clostridia bacterium]|nr:N-acetyltransferase [Clostridia bacterium]
NKRANEKNNVNYLRFAFFDFIDDPEVTDALYAALADYARELGCVAIHGPQGFSDMDREGMLVEGFDRLSQFYVYYNHPYYLDHMARLGFVKEVDWVEYLIHIPDQVPEKLAKLVERTRKHMSLEIRDLSIKKNLPKYLHDVFELYNEAYQVLFGMVPLTPKQIEKYTHEFLPLVNNKTTCLVYNDKDELVGFGVGAPSLSRANQKTRGRLFPFGWIPTLRALKGKNDRLDLFLIAVRPDLKGAGVNLVIVEDLLKKAIQNGVKYAETGPQLEMNQNVLSQWRLFDTEQHKRRRCFIRMLDGSEPPVVTRLDDLNELKAREQAKADE